jgi:hypothetical protein
MVEEANLVTVLPDLIEETNIYYTYKKDRAKYVPLREIGDILKNYPFL